MNQVDRRKFLQLSAGTLLTVTESRALSESSNTEGLASSQQSAAWPPEAKQYRFHMVANSHIDATWLWPWQEGASVVMSTFRSMLKTMEEYSDFSFTASAAQYYEWVAETDVGVMKDRLELRARRHPSRRADSSFRRKTPVICCLDAYDLCTSKAWA